jgi:prepilin-type N-terminal cleavage/methylation domain-containing protein
MSDARSHRRPRVTPGFTLLELVLVMLLMTIIMAIAAPSLSNFAKGRKSADAAQQVVALARYARGQAVSEGVVYRLHVDPGSGAYWLTVQDGGVFEPPSSGSFGQRFELPDGCHMETDIVPRDSSVVQGGAQAPLLWAEPRGDSGLPTGAHQLGMPAAGGGMGGPGGGGGGGDLFVEFYPSGRTEAATIRLVDADNNITDVGTTTPTEAFQVLASQAGSR